MWYQSATTNSEKQHQQHLLLQQQQQLQLPQKYNSIQSHLSFLFKKPIHLIFRQTAKDKGNKNYWDKKKLHLMNNLLNWKKWLYKLILLPKQRRVEKLTNKYRKKDTYTVNGNRSKYWNSTENSRRRLTNRDNNKQKKEKKDWNRVVHNYKILMNRVAD